jgi:predicted MPP superfamily phosphohydrolase
MLAIVQLSDIHFSEGGTNPLVSRVDALGSAIAAHCRDASTVVIVVTGDIAQAGLTTEYELASEFFAKLNAHLRDIQGLRAKVIWIGLPGNHDCDHRLANQLRTAAVDRMQTRGIPDHATLALAMQVLAPYEVFAAKTFMLGTTAHRLVHQYTIEHDRRTITLYAINAAWCSTNPEQYGGLWLPDEAIRTLRPTASAITLALVHYPLHWFDYATRRMLKKAIDASSQIVLTGHEHDSDRELAETREGFLCARIAAGELQAERNRESSHFSVIQCNFDKDSMSHIELSWNTRTERYETNPQLFRSIPVIRRRQGSGQEPLSMTDEFSDFLDDLGTPISHPSADTIQLDDFFVWPDIALYKSKATSQRRLVSSAELLNQLGKSVIIAGDDRAGKTSLGKQILRRLDSKHIHTLWIDMATYGNECLKSFDRALTKATEDQYGFGTFEACMQISPKNKIIIVDNYHLLPSSVDQELLLQYLENRFDTIILMASEDWLGEQATRPDSFTDLFDFQIAQIMPCGPKLRHQLVSKWVSLIPSLKSDPAATERKIASIAKLVDALLGHDLVAPFPVTLLVMLQSLSAQGGAEVNHGSLGHTYHTLVYAKLATGVSPAQTNMRIRYLTEFAWSLFQGNGRAWPQNLLDEWHRAYVDRFNLGSESENLPHMLRLAGLLDGRRGEWHFKDKYVYFYFVSEHVVQHFHEASVQEVLKGLVLRLHNEDASNIFSFVAFKSRNAAVLQMLLDRADSLFAEHPECDIGNDCAHLDRIAVDVPRLVLEMDKQAAIRASILEERDSDERERVRQYRPREDGADPESDAYVHLLMTSMRLVTVLGQVVRNHAGQLEAERMELLVRRTYALATRTLGSFVDVTEKVRPELVDEVVSMLRKRDPKVTVGDLQQQVSRRLVFMLELAAYGILKHAANSVGMGEMMDRTLGVVHNQSQNSSVAIIGTSIELDKSRAYPRQRVLDLAHQLRDRAFAMGVVRLMCLLNFYTFWVPEQDRQSICDTVGISVGKSEAFTPRARLPVARTRTSSTKGFKKRKRKR